MSLLKQFDVRGKRLSIHSDECPEHPAYTDDGYKQVTFYVDNYKKTYYRNHENKDYLPPPYKPFERAPSIIIYHNGESECNDREYADGAIEINKAEWFEYAGSILTKKIVRAFLDELIAYWQGNVYGFEITKTFKRNGKLYDTGENINSCWGYYGKSGLDAIAGEVSGESKVLAMQFKKWARYQ